MVFGSYAQKRGAIKLNKVESRVLLFIERRSNIIVPMLLVFMAALLRYSTRGFISDDARSSLLPWYQEMSQGGVVNSRQTGGKL